MALKKLAVPGVNPGGVDKLYGEDWNRLVDSVTGGAAEDFIMKGAVRVGAGGTSYAKLSVSNAGLDGMSVENVNSGGSTWGLFVGDSGLGMAGTGAIIRKGSGGSGIGGGDTLVMIRFDSNGHLGLLSGGRLYLDNVPNTGGVGGDTYISEAAANIMRFYAGGSLGFSVLDYGAAVGDGSKLELSGEGNNDYLKGNASARTIAVYLNNALKYTFAQTNLALASGVSLYVPEAAAVYFDGGVDTYIYQPADNVLTFGAGGSNVFDMRTASVRSYVDLYLSSTKKLYLDDGGDTYIYESSADVVDVITGGGRRIRIGNGVELGIQSGAADPAAGNINDGYATVWKNTTSGNIFLAVNDGGTIKKIALA